MTAIHLKAPEKTGRTIAYQYPAFGPGQPTLFWAHNGLVAFEDRRPHAEKKSGVMSWQDAGKRVLHINAMIPKAAEDPRNHFRFERQRQLKFTETMVEVIREARKQGGPFDDMKNYDKRAPMKPSPVRMGDCDLVPLGQCDF